MKNEIEVHLIDPKKLKTIMKRFCGSKATDEEITKYWKVEDGLHYMATTLGSSVDLLFKNKFAGTYNKLGETYYEKNSKEGERVKAIPQYVEIKDGKKKKLMPTGHTLEFPDVNGLFDRYNLDEFGKVTFSSEEFDEMIQLHETMESMEKVSGSSFTTVMRIVNNTMKFTIYDSPYKFLYDKPLETTASVNAYFYNPTYMVNIFKSLKDLGVETVDIYLADNKPMFFLAEGIEYIYKFALNRKVVKK